VQEEGTQASAGRILARRTTAKKRTDKDFERNHIVKLPTKNRVIGRLAVLGIAVVALFVGALAPTLGQADDDDGPNLGDEIRPAPPSIGADVPLAYFGPAPSEVQKEFVGPLQLLTSGPIDEDAGTITLPLYRGQMLNGKNAWFVLTDTTDKDNAEALGLNHSAKLAYGAVRGAARTATLQPDGTLTFSRGTVDFSPVRSVTPGAEPNPFPPAAFQPGSVGDRFYSPLVVVTNAGRHVYNAPVIAFDVDMDDLDFCGDDPNPDFSIVHDKVVSICPETEDLATVTLRLTTGFSFAKPVFYLSTDASVDVAAALEEATFAPALANIDLGNDDSAFSATERIFGFINGPVNVEGDGVNPQRQGFNSALRGEGPPLNVLGGIPTVATDYSPLWDMNLGAWTQDAIDRGYRSRLIEEFQILGMVQRGFVTGPGGADYGSVGILINCPIVFRFL
jgi:hypothetical protein